MIIEPIVFISDDAGGYRLDDSLPFKTVIDVHMLARLPGTVITIGDAEVLIESGGRSVTYERVGVTIEGHWVCRMRLRKPDADR